MSERVFIVLNNDKTQEKIIGLNLMCQIYEVKPKDIENMLKHPSKRKPKHKNLSYVKEIRELGASGFRKEWQF